MTLPIIVYLNLWRDGTILAATTEAIQFAAEYTQDDSPNLFWRSTDIAAEQVIDCDFGAVYTYDFVAILGHNLTAAAAIVVKGADDAAFTINVVSDTLTWNSSNLYEILSVARTKRYVRISLTNAANPAAYLQVGTIVVGKGNALNRGPSVPYQRGPQNETETERSPSGNIFVVQERPSVERKVLSFIGLNDASELVIEALIRECGAFKGFALCLDPAAPNTNSFWLMLTAQEMPSCDHVNYWTWTAETEGII